MIEHNGEEGKELKRQAGWFSDKNRFETQYIELGLKHETYSISSPVLLGQSKCKETVVGGCQPQRVIPWSPIPQPSWICYSAEMP